MKPLLRVLLLKASKANSTAGFSLMELLATLVIIGILAAIAGPSWSTYLNSRRASDSANVFLESFRVTQSDAAKTRRPHTIEINPNDADPPVVRFGRLSIDPDARSVETLGGADSKPGLIQLDAVDADNTSVDEIRFTGQGNIDADFLQDKDYDLPIYVSVTAPSPDAQPNVTGQKRCVVIQTLLGATRNAKDEECKP